MPFGIISSPFPLAATVEHHLKAFDNKIAETIGQNIYVDNVLTGSESIHDALIFYNEAKHIFQKAGMNLRDWASNSQQVLEKIQGQDRLHIDNMKILGLLWIVGKDQMSIKVRSTVQPESRLTKRTLLKQIASAFDPRGLFSPVILKGKLFIQTLWNQNIPWDETLSSQDSAKWNEVQEDFQRLPSSTFQIYIGFTQNIKAFTNY